MLLDHILFPGFKNQPIKNAVFIVAAPRSATTYLFHLLASEKELFTSFKLWEIVFAPGILQKYLLSAILRFDRSIGNPLRKMVLKLERKIFGNLTHIHKISLTLPEEDEAILLWNMSTVYLNFFFPDTSHFDDYFLFDDCLPLKKKRRIMNYYYRCVQRHNYVFNKSGTRRFLSKNPAMMSKVKSMHGFFPDATILNINRSPAKTIPSTIALNNTIYQFFTSAKASEYINNKTRKILINWYKMANRNITSYYAGNFVEIDFHDLVKGEQHTIELICEKLTIDSNVFYKNKQEEVEGSNHISKNKYASLEQADLEQIRIELPFLSKYML